MHPPPTMTADSGLSLGQTVVKSKSIGDRVKQEDSGPGQATDGRPNRLCAGCDDEAVVGERAVRPVREANVEAVFGGVDAFGERIEQKLDAQGLELGAGTVREALPMRCFSAQEVGQPAVAVVRERIRDDHGDAPVVVELPRAEGRADARVSAANDQQALHRLSPKSSRGSPLPCSRRASR